MTTYIFHGYSMSDFVGAMPAVGSTFRIRSTFDASTDALTFTVTDDDPTLAGSSGAMLDPSQQTAVVTNALGAQSYSGTIRVGWEATFTLADGSTLHVWDIYKASGERLGLIADGEIPPGVTFQIATYVDATSSAAWPSYSAIATPTTDPDLNQTITGGNLGDSLYGGAGDDSVSGGLGNDTVDLGTGNDTFGDWSTEGGNDLVHGGTGDDFIIGGAGNDTLWGETGADTLSGGVGSDTLYGGAGNDAFWIADDHEYDSIDGGLDTDLLDFSNAISAQGVSVTFTGASAGGYDFLGTAGYGTFTSIEQVSGTDHDDTLDGSLDSAGVSLFGAGGNDSLSGGAGNDSLSGGDGNDQIAGNAGNDTLAGGAGNDTILAGVGENLITGGLGDDSITTGGGADTIGLSLGGGTDTLTDFEMTRVGRLTTDRLDTSALAGGSGPGGIVNVLDVVVGDDGAGHAVLTFPQGERLVFQNLTPADFASITTLYEMGIPCFVAGTRIDTPHGPRLIETLRPGDRVTTFTGEAAPVLWQAARRLEAHDLRARPALCPVEIRAGALGNPEPLRLSAQHALLPETLLPETADSPLPLVRAGHLARAAPHLARIMRGARGVTYHHLLLPAHALIRADGLWAESLWPGPMAFAALTRADRLRLIARHPALAPGLLGRAPVEAAYGPPARPVLRRAELARALSRPLARCLG